MESILALDQGTTNTKVLLVGPAGEVVARGVAAVGVSHPRPGWFEQDGDDLWNSVLTAAARCLASAPGARPVGLSLATERESVLAWSRSTGRPLTPVLGWQDARTADAVARLVERGHEDEVHRLTGLTLSPMFSAPKLRWLLDSLGDTDLADVCVGTIDAYLVHRLTGAVFATDAGNASRTLLCGLESLGWHPRLLDLFGIPPEVLPTVEATNGDFGTTRAGLPLPADLRIGAVMGDSHAALFGHGLAAGAAKVTYGTGSSVMTPTAGIGTLPEAVSTTVAWLAATPVYAREGNIVATGAAIDTVARLLGTGPDGLAALAANVDSAALTIVPAFAGLAAPYWDRDAVGVVVGLARESTAEQLAYAALDAVTQQICDVVDAVEAAGDPVRIIHADGGQTVNAQLMRLQADLAGKPVVVSDKPEISALGAPPL